IRKTGTNTDDMMRSYKRPVAGARRPKRPEPAEKGQAVEWASSLPAGRRRRADSHGLPRAAHPWPCSCGGSPALALLLSAELRPRRRLTGRSPEPAIHCHVFKRFYSKESTEKKILTILP